MYTVFVAFPVGCTRNALKAGRLIDYLKANDWQLTNNCRDADLVMLSTCGFDSLSESKSLKFMPFAEKKKKKSALLVSFGCLGDINPEAILEKSNAIPITYRNLKEIDAIAEAKIKIKQFADDNVLHEHA